jgi:hypothetical protein
MIERPHAFAQVRHSFAIMAHAHDQHLPAFGVEKDTGSNPEPEFENSLEFGVRRISATRGSAHLPRGPLQTL